jgi:hypothetical protein
MCDKGQSGEYIFKTTDPLGRNVTLKSSTWNIHVIEGDNYRPEFVEQEETIKGVIEDPKFIVNDPIENRERYYDIVHLTSVDKIKPVMIAVDHSSDTGDVCTVFAQSRMKETGERGIVYVRPSK